MCIRVQKLDDPVWTARMQEVFSQISGAFEGLPPTVGCELDGEWWQATLNGSEIGYAKLSPAVRRECEQELSLAVDFAHAGIGCARNLLDEISNWSRRNGVAVLTGVIRHQNGDCIRALEALTCLGFSLEAVEKEGAKALLLAGNSVNLILNIDK